jgi:dTDP-4-amino-4,6-dideoxygalactose transaminase
MHAAVGLESLARFDERVATRDALARRYVDGLDAVPGISTQRVQPGDTSTWKDFTVAVDAAEYGVGRDRLVQVLRAEGVDTRCYFDPPVHRQHAHTPSAGPPALPVTERTAAAVVSLPIYPDLDPATVDRIVDILGAVHDRAEAVSAADSSG